MIIDAISNGIVIDHISAGKAMYLYNILGLDQLDSLFAHLGKMAFIVFVDDLSIAHNDDLDRC